MLMLALARKTRSPLGEIVSLILVYGSRSPHCRSALACANGIDCTIYIDPARYVSASAFAKLKQKVLVMLIVLLLGLCAGYLLRGISLLVDSFNGCSIYRGFSYVER
jgi:hypothetical protein